MSRFSDQWVLRRVLPEESRDLPDTNLILRRRGACAVVRVLVAEIRGLVVALVLVAVIAARVGGGLPGSAMPWLTALGAFGGLLLEDWARCRLAIRYEQFDNRDRHFLAVSPSVQKELFRVGWLLTDEEREQCIQLLLDTAWLLHDQTLRRGLAASEPRPLAHEQLSANEDAIREILRHARTRERGTHRWGWGRRSRPTDCEAALLAEQEACQRLIEHQEMRPAPWDGRTR